MKNINVNSIYDILHIPRLTITGRHILNGKLISIFVIQSLNVHFFEHSPYISSLTCVHPVICVYIVFDKLHKWFFTPSKTRGRCGFQKNIWKEVLTLRTLHATKMSPL